MINDKIGTRTSKQQVGVYNENLLLYFQINFKNKYYVVSIYY